MQTAFGDWYPEVVVMVLTRFEQAQQAVRAVREQKIVVLQAGELEPELAQRTIDFVAGGVATLDGQAERLDAHTFLFAPALVNLDHLETPLSDDKP